MAYDEGLAQRIRDCLQQRRGITEKRMFGGLAFMANGHMFVGVTGESLMARVGPSGYEGALKERHARQMDFTGKPMVGYVYVDSPALESERELLRWLEACLAFVSTLPPKVIKPRSAGKP